VRTLAPGRRAKIDAYQSLSTPEEHHTLLHRAAHGTVIYWQRWARGPNRWLKVHASDEPRFAASAQAGRSDRYMTVNEFHDWRLVKLLKSLRACYVDLDGCTDLEAAMDAVTATRMPAPSVVVYSGRGMHLYWLLEPLASNALPVWQRIQNTLINALSGIGADPAARDCTRLLRVVGSKHRKTGAVVEGRILNPRRWTLHEIADEVLGPRPAKPSIASVRDIRPRQRSGACAEFCV
jgi:hypothetical protein